MLRPVSEVCKKIGLKGCNLTLNMLLSNLDSYLSEAFINNNKEALFSGLVESTPKFVPKVYGIGELCSLNLSQGR